MNNKSKNAVIYVRTGLCYHSHEATTFIDSLACGMGRSTELLIFAGIKSVVYREYFISSHIVFKLIKFRMISKSRMSQSGVCITTLGDQHCVTDEPQDTVNPTFICQLQWALKV